MRICVLTTGRQDWGILRSTAALLRGSPDHELFLLAGGMACAAEHGDVAAELEADGFSVTRRLDWLADTAELPAFAQAGAALTMGGRALRELRPEALMLVGDRFEALAIAQAATLVGVPIVHLHGGEETEGAIDNVIRHAITKLSHLHLVSHPEYAARVRAMGEAATSVHVVGAPGLDNLRRPDLLSRAELAASLGLPLTAPVVGVTVHPTTLTDTPDAEVRAVIAAMDRIDATYVITLPNNDEGHAACRSALVAAAARPRRTAIASLGDRRYASLLRVADALLGNSSSAMIEAPAVNLPAVNVGDRQKGRLRGENVIDVAAERDAVTEGLRRALTTDFRAAVARAPGPFGDGRSAPRILEILNRWAPPPLLRKRWSGPG